jgi:hypothetical protein
MNGKKWIDFYGIFRASSACHFHIFQGMAFLATIWMFLSWDFGAIAHFDYNLIHYDRELILVYWKGPAFYYTTGQFIYEFLQRPSASTLTFLQGLVVFCSVLGLLGIIPRVAARIAFLLAAHLIGMHLMANSAMGGGTELLVASLLILSVSPKNAFYRFGKKPDWSDKSIDYHWPVFLLLFVFGAYYSTAGVNKLIEARSLCWGHNIRLDLYSQKAIQDSFFLSSDSHNLFVCSLLSNELASRLLGYATVLVELSAIAWLWVPLLRFILPPSLALMHVIIFLHHGYGGYLMYVFLLMACIDFNALYTSFELSRTTVRGSRVKGSAPVGSHS